MGDPKPGSDRPRIRLFTQSMNPYSEKVAAALALKQLPFERVVSDDPADVERWSPIARTLPVLEIDGRRRADSLEIVAWLDTLFPEPALYSPDPRTAEQQRHLAAWSDDSFAWYWNQWRSARYPRPGDENPADASLFERMKDKITRSLGHAPTTRADARELEIIQKIEDRLTDLVGFLRDRPYYYADEPSIADLAIYSMLQVLRNGPIPHCPEAIEERPTLVAFLDRMGTRIASFEALRDTEIPASSGATPTTGATHA